MKLVILMELALQVKKQPREFVWRQEHQTESERYNSQIGHWHGAKKNSKNATQISSKKNSNITKQQDNKRAKLKNRKQLCNMEIQKRNTAKLVKNKKSHSEEKSDHNKRHYLRFTISEILYEKSEFGFFFAERSVYKTISQ